MRCRNQRPRRLGTLQVAFDVRAGFVSMDEAALNNVLQNLLLRFGIVSANSVFQIVKGATIEVEAEQPIEAAHHCSLRDAQLDNLRSPQPKATSREVYLSDAPLLEVPDRLRSR